MYYNFKNTLNTTLYFHTECPVTQICSYSYWIKFNLKKKMTRRQWICNKITILTYLLTSWSRVLLDKLTGSAASQEIPRILWNPKVHYRIHKRRHLSLSWANSIHSPPPRISWRSILILSSHLRLGLPNGIFPSGFPTRTLCTPLHSPIRATIKIIIIHTQTIHNVHLSVNDYTSETNNSGGRV